MWRSQIETLLLTPAVNCTIKHLLTPRAWRSALSNSSMRECLHFSWQTEVCQSMTQSPWVPCYFWNNCIYSHAGLLAAWACCCRHRVMDCLGLDRRTSGTMKSMEQMQDWHYREEIMRLEIMSFLWNSLNLCRALPQLPLPSSLSTISLGKFILSISAQGTKYSVPVTAIAGLFMIQGDHISSLEKKTK